MAPKVKNGKWPLNPVDRFLLARMEQKGVIPVADADRPTWIRRVTLDLIGLPPTPAEIDSFLKDRRRDAYARVVDRLLASDRFGECWGRRWLDVARYAESVGSARNYAFPLAWRYRNYVIDSFNRDKPFDQFIKEQIAGDLLPATTEKQHDEQVTAAGFLALSAFELSDANAAKLRMDIADEQITTTTRAFLALTVGCARCHDHKFDPIPTIDYCALAGIFRSTELLSGLRSGVPKGRPPDDASYFNIALLAKLSEPKPDPEMVKQWEEIQIQSKQLQEDVLKITGIKLGDRRQAAGLKVLSEMDKFSLPANVVMSVRDSEQEVGDCQVNIHGDAKQLGPTVPRGFLQVVSRPGEKDAIGPKESGRLELAEWLIRRDNPLTARVAVNRMWQGMFGRGIVADVDNFGFLGDRPSNPELLDYLALRFMGQGWSVKKMLREMALSRAYRLSTAYQAQNANIDADDLLMWRMNRRRLEVEALRDSLLMIGGALDLNRPANSPVFHFKRAYDIGEKAGAQPEDYTVAMRNRTVYVPVLRNFMPPLFEAFDFPEPSESRGRRDVTTVPTQALFLMNSPFVVEQSRLAADKLLAASAPSDRERVLQVYRETIGRAPTAEELNRSLEFMKSIAPSMSERNVWGLLYQAMFVSAEFRYRN